MTVRAIRSSDLCTPHCRKSSHRDTESENCVDVARKVPRVVPVRDGTCAEVDGPVPALPATGWEAFRRGMKPGRL